VNDADWLGHDPAMRRVIGDKAVERGGVSTSQMGRFETELLATNDKLTALAELSGIWIDWVNNRKCTIRLPANKVLQDSIAPPLKRLVSRPPNGVRRYLANFRYLAASWTKPRRVIAKVEWHPGELYPRVGFIVTNLSRPAERVVAFYNQHGTAEQNIKEGKNAVRWTRLPSRRHSSAMLSSLRRPSSTIRIFSSNPYRFRVLRRMSLTIRSADNFLATNFCLIFAPSSLL
jgi:hypothetical protein